MFNLSVKTTKVAAKIACAALVALALCSLTACMKPQPTPVDEQQELTPSQYMINVNQVAENLGASLQEFKQAVNDNDISAMQAKADAAFAVLDELDDMEVPDSLNDVKEKYGEAVSILKGALNDYIALYTEISDANEDHPFDYTNYAERLESIQKQYDSGLTTLEEADKLAAEK